VRPAFNVQFALTTESGIIVGRDGPGVSQWRQRMGTAAAKTTYKERSATAEWVNAGPRQRDLYRRAFGACWVG
jgi:hypothetical protein